MQFLFRCFSNEKGNGPFVFLWLLSELYWGLWGTTVFKEVNIRLEGSEQEAELRLVVIDYQLVEFKNSPYFRKKNYAECHIFPRNKQNLLAVIRRADQARLSHNVPFSDSGATITADQYRGEINFLQKRCDGRDWRCCSALLCLLKPTL